MQFGLLGAVIAGLISITCGLTACFYGFRGPPLGNDPDAALPAKQHWHDTWGMWLRPASVGGFLLNRAVANGKKLLILLVGGNGLEPLTSCV